MIKRQGIVIISAILIIMSHIIHKGYLNYLQTNLLERPNVVVPYMCMGLLLLGWTGVILEIRDNPYALIGSGIVMVSQLCFMLQDIRTDVDVNPKFLMWLQVAGWIIFGYGVPQSGTPPAKHQVILSVLMGIAMSALIFIGLPKSEELQSVYSPVLVMMMLIWVVWARYMRLIRK